MFGFESSSSTKKFKICILLNKASYTNIVFQQEPLEGWNKGVPDILTGTPGIHAKVNDVLSAQVVYKRHLVTKLKQAT